MLTQLCYIVCGQEMSSSTHKVTPFEIRYSNDVTASLPGDNLHWRPADTERFQLIAGETVKIGQPVNRDDALYWIEQIRTRGGLALGEDVGWLAVATEAEERLLEMVDVRLERLLKAEA